MTTGRGAIQREDIRLNLGKIRVEPAGPGLRWQTTAITARTGGKNQANYRKNKELLIIVTLRCSQFGLTIELSRYAT